MRNEKDFKVDETKRDLKLNGWYKSVLPDDVDIYGFTYGKYYYFKDGYTVDDFGHKRPYHGNTTKSDSWIKRVYLVPADTEQDAFDRIINAIAACDEMGGCHELRCPYADFGADNHSEECFWMIKEDGKKATKRQYDEKLEWPKHGLTVRRRDDLSVYIVDSITNSAELSYHGIADIHLVSLVPGYNCTEAWVKCKDFWEQYEYFDPKTDGWNGRVVSTCNYLDDYGNTILCRGEECAVTNGLVCGNSPMFIKDPSEFKKKHNTQAVFEIEGYCPHSPSKMFNYTGRALRTCNFSNDKHSKFRVGYVYNFINGRVADDENTCVLYDEASFHDCFIPLNE